VQEQFLFLKTQADVSSESEINKSGHKYHWSVVLKSCENLITLDTDLSHGS